MEDNEKELNDILWDVIVCLKLSFLKILANDVYR